MLQIGKKNLKGLSADEINFLLSNYKKSFQSNQISSLLLIFARKLSPRSRNQKQIDRAENWDFFSQDSFTTNQETTGSNPSLKFQIPENLLYHYSNILVDNTIIKEQTNIEFSSSENTIKSRGSSKFTRKSVSKLEQQSIEASLANKLEYSESLNYNVAKLQSSPILVLYIFVYHFHFIYEKLLI